MRKIMLVGVPVLVLLWLGGNWMLRTHDDAFTEEGLLQADAADLDRTTVTSHLEVPLQSDENVLWCGSFQLAWNEACSLVGFLIDEYGAENFHKLCRQIRDGKSFDDALRTTYPTKIRNIGELNKAWLDGVRKG